MKKITKEKKITEKEIVGHVIASFQSLPPTEMVEEYNRIFGTKFTIDEIGWSEYEMGAILDDEN